MDELFWIGQVAWLAVLACGAYVSISFWNLGDAESAKSAEPDKRVPPAAEPRPESSGFNVSQESERS